MKYTKITSYNQYTKDGSFVDYNAVFRTKTTVKDFERAFQTAGFPLTFQKKGISYRAKEARGIALFQKHGEWLLANHSGKYNLPNGNLWNVVKEIYGLTDPKEIAEKVAEAKGISISYTSERPSPQPKFIPQIEAKPISNELKISGTVVHCYWNTPQGRRTFNFLHRKTGANIELLDRYHVRPIKSHNWDVYNGKAIAYTYQVGETIKRKRKIFDGKKDDWKCIYVQNRAGSDYIFGFNQLPNECNAVVICAGEDDTLCLNANLNEYGIYGVCLSGEAATLKAELVSELRKRCNDNLFVWYDFDNTGIKISTKFQNEFGIPRIDHSKHLGLNDICDLYGAIGASGLLQIFAIETAQRHTITKNGKSFVGTKIEIDKYLSEKSGEIFSLLGSHEAVILSSPTGSGKTSLLRQVVENPYLIGMDKAILVFPTRSILHQQAKQFNSDSDLPILDGESSPLDLDKYAIASGALATYDSAPKLLSHIHAHEKTVLIMDESHLQVDAQGYRKTALDNLQTLAGVCQKIIYLSGTPCIEFAKLFGLHWIEIEQADTQHIEITPIQYTSKTKQRDLIHKIIELQKQHGGRFMVRLNNVEVLEEWKSKIEIQGKTAVIFTSKDTRYTESQEYTNLLEAGTVQADFILTTSLLDCGVSVTSGVVGVVTIGANVREVLQLVARPRKAGCTNERLNLFVFKAQDKPKENASDFDFDKCLKLFLDTATATAKEANEIHGYEEAETFKRYQENNLIYLNPITNLYEPSKAQILYRLEGLKAQNQTFDGYISEISGGLASYTIHKSQILEIESEIKPKENIDETRIKDAIESTSLETLTDALYHATTNKRIKIKIKKSNISIIQKTVSEPAKQFIQDFGDVLKPLENDMGKMIRLLEMGISKNCISKLYATIKDDFKITSERLRVYLERTQMKRSRETLLRIKQYEALENVLDKFIGKPLMFKQIFGIVRKNLGKHLNRETIILRVKELYEVTESRKDRQTFWMLESRINLEHILPML